MLREVMQMLTLSHADSNEAPWPPHPGPMLPTATPLSTPVPSAPSSMYNSRRAFCSNPQMSQLPSSSCSSGAQPWHSQHAQRYSADHELHQQASSGQIRRLSSMDPSLVLGGPCDLLAIPLDDPQHAQHMQQRRSQELPQHAQHTHQCHSRDVAQQHGDSDLERQGFSSQPLPSEAGGQVQHQDTAGEKLQRRCG